MHDFFWSSKKVVYRYNYSGSNENSNTRLYVRLISISTNSCIVVITIQQRYKLCNDLLKLSLEGVFWTRAFFPFGCFSGDVVLLLSRFDMLIPLLFLMFFVVILRRSNCWYCCLLQKWVKWAAVIVWCLLSYVDVISRCTSVCFV
jgi:hypothetical protein